LKFFWPQNNKSLEETIVFLNQQATFRPFNEEALSFTQALSKRFLKLRSLPEVVALGYWLRKANIKQLQTHFEEQNRDEIIKARGTVFHIAPSNVDTIFVYSWLLSLLAGNRNVIRISSKTGMNELLQIILEELPHYEGISNRTIICTYDHSEKEATYLISKYCHTRVIWGGDTTIQSIRQVPLAPLANELAFADRFSLAVLNGNKVASLDEQQLDQLVEHFYNDSFWFNQMACSSPRLIIWTGEKPERFWTTFEKKIQEKNYELLAATQVTKYTTSLQLAVEDYVENVTPKTYFSRVSLEELPIEAREKHCGGGLFYEYGIQRLVDASKIISDKDQTMAYYGFEKEELNELIQHISTRGIDRVVPIGQALDFDDIWDGQNFLTSFTRKVIIR